MLLVLPALPCTPPTCRLPLLRDAVGDAKHEWERRLDVSSGKHGRGRPAHSSQHASINKAAEPCVTSHMSQACTRVSL